MQITVDTIALLIDGQVEGDGSLAIHGPSRIEEGQPGTITFLADLRYEEFAYTTQASALLVSRDFKPRQPLRPTLIRVADVRQAVAALLERFDGSREVHRGVSPQAAVEDSATLAPDVSVGHFSVVGQGARIGAGTMIHDQVFVGADVQIGARCVLHPGVRILHGCILGDEVVIHSNTVIGSDGFGFAPQPDGSYVKVPQVGRVHIASRVEIGANCVIDRATMGETVIEEGVKLDNLIHIAHNVRVGAHTVMAAQVGVAGSTRIGRYCQFGGQAGVAGHLEVADGTRVQAQSGIASTQPVEGQALFGSPAIGYKDYIRSYGVFKQLPDLDRRLRRLERLLERDTGEAG
jgi:UDP-3-O-[3-hydroxymyristoyl] glucosamine N-acyltransferase